MLYYVFDVHPANDTDLIPIILGDSMEDIDHMRTQFLSSIHQFRPPETIFEVTKLAKSSTTEIMGCRRKERNKLLQSTTKSLKPDLMDFHNHPSLIEPGLEPTTEDQLQVGRIVIF
jgi:hypothetical protein